MRRWDRLVDGYLEEYRARGVSAASVAYTQARLDRWGRWLKRRRPRIAIEAIDAELLTRYIASCSSFRAKATVYGTLSTMRGFGDDLVRQGLWKLNPLRWMKGPKVTPYSRLPKRAHHSDWAAFPIGLPDAAARIHENKTTLDQRRPKLRVCISYRTHDRAAEFRSWLPLDFDFSRTDPVRLSFLKFGGSFGLYVQLHKHANLSKPVY